MKHHAMGPRLALNFPVIDLASAWGHGVRAPVEVCIAEFVMGSCLGYGVGVSGVKL